MIICVCIYTVDRPDYDLEMLKKECQNLNLLLVPACEVQLIITLGEGNYVSYI